MPSYRVDLFGLEENAARTMTEAKRLEILHCLSAGSAATKCPWGESVAKEFEEFQRPD